MGDMYETELRVYGKRQDLDKFKSSIKSTNEDHVIDFNKIIPMPEDLSKWDEGERGSGKYHWTLKHWGAMYGSFGSMLVDEGDHLYYLITTVCDPPFPIYDTLISMYPTLDFHIIGVEGQAYKTVDILSKQGNITEYIRWTYTSVWCLNNECIDHYLKTNYVNGKLQVVNGPPVLY